MFLLFMELYLRAGQVSMGMPEAQINEFAIYGTLEAMLIQIKLFEDTGIQYLIVDLDPST
jgi:hypothetical protein